MSLSLVFRPIAQAEYDDAVSWYERKKVGLGSDFRRVVERTLEQIAVAPLRFRPVDQHTRRALLRRFPYAIHFAIESDTVVILAIFHTRRNPEDLRGRA